MARGGRSHYRGRGRGGGGGNAGEALQAAMDTIAGLPTPPMVAGGVFFLQGNELTVTHHLRTLTDTPDFVYCQSGPQMFNNFDPTQPTLQTLQTQPSQPLDVSMIPMQVFPPTPVAPIQGSQGSLVETRINVVGSKTEGTSKCCYNFTLFLGIILIFPLFFMCCDWWKRIVYPKYVVNLQFYVLLGNFLKKNLTCRLLNLTVADSGFDREKARVLCESLNGSSINALTFKNSSNPTNYKNSEFDDFQANVQPIKALPINSSFTWGSLMF